MQIFISFVANKISEEQQKQGLSFEKCKELVTTVVKEKYLSKNIDNEIFVFTDSFERENIKSEFEIDNELKYLSNYPIKADTKHFKPIVVMVLEDIFNLLNTPVSIKKLTKTVFALLDQSVFVNVKYEETVQDNYESTENFDILIKKILLGLSKEDAQIILEYIFQTNGEISFSALAEKYNLPKSTVHHKIETFKKKIFENYIPENVEDGVRFIKNLSSALDELAK
jgi:DNA-binding MarR family transcriptional regulator